MSSKLDSYVALSWNIHQGQLMYSVPIGQWNYQTSHLYNQFLDNPFKSSLFLLQFKSFVYEILLFTSFLHHDTEEKKHVVTKILALLLCFCACHSHSIITQENSKKTSQCLYSSVTRAIPFLTPAQGTEKLMPPWHNEPCICTRFWHVWNIRPSVQKVRGERNTHLFLLARGEKTRRYANFSSHNRPPTLFSLSHSDRDRRRPPDHTLFGFLESHSSENKSHGKLCLWSWLTAAEG